jgi:hypothetical protein
MDRRKETAMNNREKALLAGLGGLALILILVLSLYTLFLWPADECRNQAREWEKKIEAAQAMKAKESQYKARLVELAGNAFGDDEMVVSEQVRTTVTSLLEISGLSTQNMSLKPLLGSRVPNVYREIGWSVQIRGKLEQIVNFLYLMSKEPHLHRVENVIMSPASGGDLSLQVKYATLLLEAPRDNPSEKLVTNTIKDHVLSPEILASEEAHLYDVITDRDLFRPFIERRRPPAVATVAPPTGGGGSSETVRTPAARTGGDRIVGLPTYDGIPEIIIANTSSGKISKYKEGDALGGGKVVMVDYRLMPLPHSPDLISESRVILRIGTEYYAVELGQVLTEKRTLAPSDWPPSLPKLQTVDVGPSPTPTAVKSPAPTAPAPAPVAPAVNKK